ncbi:MAG: inorganic phosphate transporter, partial [Chthoniobacterales bacterium]
MILFILVVLAAIAFEYINGFHDAANAIATVVSTKVLTPRQAIAMAAFFNLTGALTGTAVASTIGKGIVDLHVVTMPTILCALIGAIVWNLITWMLGLPSS